MTNYFLRLLASKLQIAAALTLCLSTLTAQAAGDLATSSPVVESAIGSDDVASVVVAVEPAPSDHTLSNTAPETTPPPSLTLLPDVPISEQLRVFSLQHGWTLMWEASEYKTSVGQIIFGTPDVVAAYFLEGARNGGVSLNGVVHSQIKIIQISE